MNCEHTLVFRFDDQSSSFTNGWECGELWKDMENQIEIERTVHGENLEMIQRMGSKHGYITKLKSLDNGWFHLSARPS